jgi:hypothetical protein
MLKRRKLLTRKAEGGWRALFVLYWLLVLSSVSSIALASDDTFYDAIVSVDTLMAVLGEAEETTQFTDQGAYFTHYYSPALNRSFLVDDELGQVCNTYKGSEILSCFPCKLDEVSTECP